MPAADTVFLGGPVATMDPAGSFTDAVAVREGRIVALGHAETTALVSGRTEVVELRGRLLLPGLQDAHVHPLYGGLQRIRCDLTDSASEAECLHRVAEYAAANPRVEWILGGGWEMGLFAGGCPSSTALDEVTGDRPALLINEDQHGAWVNSAALRRAGVHRDTPDPPGGRVERDHHGRPTGTLHETAVDLVSRHVPPTPDSEYLRALSEGQRHLHERGVTAWHDAILGSYLGYPDPLDYYRQLDGRHLLTGRVTGSLWWNRTRGLEQVPELTHRSRTAVGNRFGTRSVKIMLDGVCENFTAAMLRPYLHGHGHGIAYVPQPDLDEAVRVLDAAGFGVHFHAVGDLAVRQALDAVEAARNANGPSANRHQIAHLQVVDPADLPRFAELGVVANIQAEWAHNDTAMLELTAPYLGRERYDQQYPFRTLLDSGALLAAGSDWPVSEAAPMRAVHTAVNRTEPGDDRCPLLPEQSLELADALAATTIGSARAHYLEGHTGSVERGKCADLTLLDRNPFEVPPNEIGETGVDLTMVGGQVVHSSGR
ncbi:amidohydrolase [Actinopolyspora mortivallis]|uniref:Amidohydrolase n=1 Tax=Actinopolyspora mortivallis TaxID=33906 RepID=A0A2T0GUQ3_ACTMO|nr:amidohydrolase [Actinopolyspora mortivallis]PRW62830.1 amidohydrolase [Actinopolyspora mortivallis]